MKQKAFDEDGQRLQHRQFGFVGYIQRHDIADRLRRVLMRLAVMKRRSCSLSPFLHTLAG
ncbi:hypothetical protein [Rhizobium sp.]